MRKARVVSLVAVCALATGSVRAAGPLQPPLSARSWTEAGPEDRVGLDLPVDLTLIGVGLAGTVVPELLKSTLAPDHCVVCNGDDNSGLGGDAGKNELNGVDAFFHDNLTGALFSRKTADTVSNGWVFALAPVYAFGGAFLFTGPHASPGAGARNAVLVGESAILSLAVIQSSKYLVARKRPFVRYGHGTNGADPDTGTTYDLTSNDSHLSFPSGHTAAATSLAVSLAMIATLEESSAAPYLWGGAAVASIGAAALRMMAEKHYFTDVGVGALVGASVGVLVPWLHRRGGLLSDHGAGVSVASRGDGAPLVVLSGSL